MNKGTREQFTSEGETLALLCDCVAQVERILNDHGMSPDDDHELTEAIIAALLLKAHDSEFGPERLVSRALLKAWAHIGAIDAHNDRVN